MTEEQTTPTFEEPHWDRDLASLYIKMSRVMGHLERLPKRGTNKHFGYAYVTDSDVLDAVRKAMAEEKLAFFVDVGEVATNGKRTTTQLLITFADGDTGATKTINWLGEADDSQDKGINKAITAGVKYALLKTFLMSTGNDDDPDGGGSSEGGTKTAGSTSTGNAGAYKMRFGMHTGKTIAEIGGNPADAGYLKWALEKLDDDERNAELFAAIKAYLGMTDGTTETAIVFDEPPPDIGDLEPQRKNWPAVIVSDIIDAHLAANTPNTLGMLNLSKVIHTSDSKERIMTWAALYRSARAEMGSKDAASTADTELVKQEAEPQYDGDPREDPDHPDHWQTE